MTTKYMLVMKQKATGCDHGIGCGMSFSTFLGDDDDEAIEQAEYHFCGGKPIGACDFTPYHGENELESMMVCRVLEELPIKDWTRAIQLANDEEARLELEKKERAEYNRLKEKYGSEFFGG